MACLKGNSKQKGERGAGNRKGDNDTVSLVICGAGARRQGDNNSVPMAGRRGATTPSPRQVPATAVYKPSVSEISCIAFKASPANSGNGIPNFSIDRMASRSAPAANLCSFILFVIDFTLTLPTFLSG